ncbi:WcaF family extracellular polysaccharide biosynthesis acetyltransferase [Winogradskyella aurantia]|uniref:Colanic acid biosynthesis acetyltransferase WcaF n=1 Tax=Winogradskyella aurantia TaxID=1915063 RepID=A0A265UZT3_9FLAO|nr:WcaF family extracellular polysaccharide biosynthesis acetyltransferase [Winogradskyella aurantia]OZV70815.1 colanic acid biosynthesis acetyltransferase WcaF [Winogradskyella aurantia]
MTRPTKQNLELYKNPKGFRGRSAVTVQLWWLVHFFLFKPSPQFLYGWRRFLARSFGAKIGKNVLLRPSVQMTYPWKVSIGDNSWIGDEVVLYSLGNIDIGSNSVISQRSYLCTGSHDYTDVSFPIYENQIKIGNECWIATDVFVAPGVVIGDRAVIGSRSTVLKGVEEGTVNIGSPCRMIKKR